MRIVVFAVGALVFIGILYYTALAHDDTFTSVDEIDQDSFWLAVGNERMLPIMHDSKDEPRRQAS